jgi:glutamyl-tRNA reductase
VRTPPPPPPHRSEDLVTKTVAVLGTGTMGAGMARNLIGAGST